MLLNAGNFTAAPFHREKPGWSAFCEESATMKAIIYLIGTIVVLAGVLYGASVAGVPQTWLIVIGLVILGFGIMGAARSASSTTKAVETTSAAGAAPVTRETRVSSEG